MSRLDSVIRRLMAQRTCLNMAADMIAAREGCVLEIGLGNGRTFDHLRSLMPGREIFVFDRQVAAHPSCVPDDQHLFLGDLNDTLPQAIDRLGATAVLAHVDIGAGDPEIDRMIAQLLARELPALLAPGALILSDQNVEVAGAVDLDLPEGVEPGRYYFRKR